MMGIHTVRRAVMHTSQCIGVLLRSVELLVACADGDADSQCTVH